MQIQVNLDDVKENVDPGWYLAKVVGEEVKENKDKSGEYINWELEIAEPDSEFNGQKLWHITSLKDNALPMLKRFLEACDFAWGAEGFTTEEVLGCELEVKVEQEMYEGKQKDKVVQVRQI